MNNFHVAMLESKINELLLSFPELLEDEVLWMDTLEGETNIDKVINKLLSNIADDGELADSVADTIRKMQERKKRFEKRVEFNRALIQHILETANIKKMELPLGTVSLRAKPASVLIFDESAIPDKYMRIKKEPDKTAIKAALESKEEVSGALLSNGGIGLTVRV